ncbi:MAG TPA: MCE family protein [Acidimicrobiales bacterium]|nr:MCE family protein [Acidimicrobiales bacterium]
MSRRLLAFGTIVAVVAVVVAVVSVTVLRSTPTYPMKAVFASANGLFPGNSVEMLGAPVGTVTEVVNTGNTVLVSMEVQTKYPVPAGVQAALVSPQVLGEPSIELSPGYTGGNQMPPGHTIPLSRTSVPVSTDQLLKDVQSFLSQVNPQATGSLITNLSQDLSGQGASLNQLLGNAAGTIQLLAQQGNNLGQLTTSLAQITATLQTRTTTLSNLITDYNTVSAVVASHQAQLGTAISQLAGATNQLSQFLGPNLVPLESDVAGVTQVTRTVSSNLGNLDTLLNSTNLLFAAAGRAYDPTQNWLNLNLALPPGTSASVVSGYIRDRLAGICRRLLANHAAGLPAATLQTLGVCGDPNSGFFNPLLGVIPSILNQLTSGPGGGPSATALAALIAKGMTMIPGAADIQPPAATTPAPTAVSSAPAAPSLSSPATSQLPPLPTVPSAPPSSGGGLGGLLKSLLGDL